MMDDSGHRENGRHKPEMYKPPQSQWLMQQPSMKHIMSIMAERDAAIQERNMAISEKNKALEERDLAIMQRETAIQERNEAIMERDNALAALQFRQNSMNGNNSCPPGCQISRGIKHMHHPQQHAQHPSHVGEASYDGRDVQVPDAVPLTSLPPENAKSRKVKRTKEPSATSPNKKTSKSGRKAKREGEDLNKMMFSKSQEWKGMQDMGGSDGYNKQLGGSKSDWKGPDLGLNQVAFDESTMPPPVCSCTGVYRQCYKWGNGGWQSSCCTTTMSMYPLPSVPNKRHARIGGRKMSGSAFSKLLSRLAAEGHDLSTSVDLKDHWAKHGTNRYITIRADLRRQIGSNVVVAPSPEPPNFPLKPLCVKARRESRYQRLYSRCLSWAL